VTDDRRSRRRSTSCGRALVVVAFALALLAGTMAPAVAFAAPAIPTPTAFAPSAPGAATSPGGATSPKAAPASSLPQEPTIQYEDAMAHANDPNRFVPSGRVTVPFQPRATDRVLVDGALPRSLPAGRESGASRTISNASEQIGRAGTSASPITTGPTTLAASAVPAASTGLRRQVFGFLPYWQLGDPTTTLNDSLLSTIAYFSVAVDRSGNLVEKNSDGSTSTGWGGWTSAQLTTVINQAHQQGTRVVLCLTLFAWTTSDAATQGAFLGNPTARDNLARQAAAAVRDRGADGINLDFEPIASGHSADFTALVRSIRTQLDAIAPGYQLTFDTTAETANYPLEDATAPGGADSVFVMGYDYRTDGATYAGSIDPLNGPTYDLTETVQAYLARLPASKIILGVPYYGRVWSTVSNAPNSKNQSGTEYGTSTSVEYVNAVDVATANGRQYDQIERSPFTVYQRQNCTSTYGCVTSWRELYYDDAQSLGEKYDMVNRFGLAGVGMWALGYDGTRPELYQALADKFLNDTTPPVAGILALAPSQSQESFPVSWTAIDDWSGVASYDVQVSADGGAWTSWLTGTSLTSSVYAGHDGHGYAFRVRATDGKGNVGSWDVSTVYMPNPTLAPGGFATTLVDGLNERAAADPNAQRVTSLPIGSLVAITGGPVSAGGYTWYQVTAPIAEWNPVSPVLVGVWVAAGSGGMPYLAPAPAPNTTVVAAAIGGLSYGDPPVPAGASGAAAAFSPNGDGVQDTIAISWTNDTPFSSVSLRISRADGTQVGIVPVGGEGTGPQSFVWDGTVNGAVQPDGVYLVQLVASNGATTITAPSVLSTGTQAAAWGITIDTTPPVLAGAAVNRTLFSPNGDGRLDDLTLTATATGAVRWQVAVAPLAAGVPGTTVRTITGTGAAVSATWDGRGDGGAVLPDGAYRLTLTATDAAGNAASLTFDVTLDTAPPVVTASLTNTSFSPNGDGWADTTALTWKAGELATGTLELLHGSSVVRSWPVASAAAGTISWDGRDAHGRGVSDGRYIFRLTVQDAAGNQAVRTVVVTADRTARLLRWHPTRFSPRSSGSAAQSTVTYALTRTATTTLMIVGPTGRTVRTAWSARSQSKGVQGWTWDGRDAGRHAVPAGRYIAVLMVHTALGTTTVMRTVIVR